MSKIEDDLKSLLGSARDTLQGEIRDMIKEAKSDGSEFIKKQGKAMERYVAALAKGDISKAEFEDLSRGLASLHKIELHRLSAGVKSRAQELSSKITDLVIDGMLKMI